MNEVAGFRVHLLIPRIDPEKPGLTELYRGIRARRPQRGETRHMMDQDLAVLNRNWALALRIMKSMGCVEWTVSTDPNHIPRTWAP